MDIRTIDTGSFMKEAYEFRQTNLKVGEYRIQFKYTNRAVDDVQRMLLACKDMKPLSEDRISHMRKIDSCYIAKLENKFMRIKEAFTDNNDRQDAQLAVASLNGLEYLDSHLIENPKVLIDFWRICSINCYNDIDVDTEQFRLKLPYETLLEDSDVITDATDISNRLADLFKFTAGNVTLTPILKFIYLSMIDPFNRGSQRLALIMLTHDLGVKGLPIARVFYEQYREYKNIFKNYVYATGGCIEITLMLNVLMNSIKDACSQYINGCRDITNIERTILASMDINKDIEPCAFASMCSTHHQDAYKLASKFKAMGKVIEEPKDVLVRIADV